MLDAIANQTRRKPSSNGPTPKLSHGKKCMREGKRGRKRWSHTDWQSNRRKRERERDVPENPRNARAVKVRMKARFSSSLGETRETNASAIYDLRRLHRDFLRIKRRRIYEDDFARATEEDLRVEPIEVE